MHWLTPRKIALAQGAYYATTGLWPLLSMETFLAVTGPKTDLWLVRTVSLLILVIGLALLTASQRNGVSLPITVLGAGSAACLAWVDTYYALTGAIWPVYLLDAFPEVAIIVGWLLAHWIVRRRGSIA